MMTSSRIETTTNCRTETTTGYRTETTTGYRTETMIVLLLAVVNDLTIRKGQYSELGYCFFHLERLYHHYLPKSLAVCKICRIFASRFFFILVELFN